MALPVRTFSADVGQTSEGTTRGPDAIENDLDAIFNVLDNTKTGIGADSLKAGAGTDTVLGSRTADPTIATAYALSGTLTQHLSWIIKNIKALKGVAGNWYDATSVTIEALYTDFLAHVAQNHVGSVDGVSVLDGADIDLVAGSGISIVPNNTAKTITINSIGVSAPDLHASTHAPSGSDSLEASYVPWALYADVVIDIMHPPSGLSAAVGNGSTDDSTAIQACIDYANSAGGGVVVFSAHHTFKIVAAHLVQKSNVHLLGLPGAVLDMTTVAVSGGYKHGVKAEGTLGDSILLTANATAGLYSVTVASVTGLAVGDWVQIATEGANYYPYANDPAYNVDRGEIKRIRDITDLTLTFETAFYDEYTTANSAFIKKISFIENVSVKGLKILGDTAADSAEMGIYYKFVNKFAIEDCDLENQDLYQIGLISCIDGDIHDNRGRQSFYNGTTGSTFYGIAVLDSCQWLRIHDNYGSRMRHLIVTSAHSSGQSVWGQPRQIVATGNIMENAMAGADGRSYAYEHHGFGEDIIFHSNVADSCHQGFNIEGGGISIIGNIIKNWYFCAIGNGDQGSYFKNVVIRDNMITGPHTAEGGGTTYPIAIRFAFQTGDVIKSILIENNNIEQELDDTSAIWFSSAAALVADDLIIRGNNIRNISTNQGDSYAIYVPANLTGVKVKDNIIQDSAAGIYSGGPESVIEGNIFDYPSARSPIAGYMIYVGGNDNWVLNNIIRRSYTGIRVNTGVTGGVVANNVIRSDSATISDAGTATTKQNNVEIVY